MKARDWKVTVRNYNFTYKEVFAQEIDVKRILIHPEFSEARHNTSNKLFSVFENDIGAYTLSRWGLEAKIFIRRENVRISFFYIM